MEDEVESVDNRNTPIISTGGTGTGRVGDPGFDRLIIADTFLARRIQRLTGCDLAWRDMASTLSAERRMEVRL